MKTVDIGSLRVRSSTTIQRVEVWCLGTMVTPMREISTLEWESEMEFSTLRTEQSIRARNFFQSYSFIRICKAYRSLSKCRKIKNQVKCIGVLYEQKYFSFKDVKIKQTTIKTSPVGVLCYSRKYKTKKIIV